MCTHTCLLYSFPLILFGDALLLLSSCRREGVHPELPGVQGLLGIHLPVDIPVVPSFDESLRICFYASAYSVSDIFVINVINNIRIRFIISFYVICAMIYCPLCNTRFIKGHKPSSHIRARIKSHVYTTE